jgi:DNA helicase-2/ATP-dependent DNA helicase PcrA
MALRDEFLHCVTKAAVPVLTKLQRLLQTLMNGSPDRCPLEIIEILLENGYREYLQARYTDSLSREEDLRQMGVFSTRFRSLEAFLSEVALMTNMAEERNPDPDTAVEGKIVLTTIHQAKGLEWSVVLMIWCADGMMPLARALKDPDGEEEERRLFYVATTRAKDRLYLCYPRLDYSRGMGSMALNPSRFIRELSPTQRYSKSCPYEQWMIDESYDD